MKPVFTFIQFSIVFTAHANNPTILNKDFLQFNEIVDKEWKLKNPPICTEPFAQVHFKNDIAITSQLDKIIFKVDKTPIDEESFKQIHQIAKKYLDLIQHVNYTGVGINSNLLFEIPNDVGSPEYLINHFFKKDLNNPKFPIESLGLKFHIPTDSGNMCNLDFLPLKSGSNEKETSKILIVSNFHHPVPKKIDEKINFMNQTIDDYKDDIGLLTRELLPFFFGG